MPTLNIKSERVYELARELAAATGESMTGAIETALAERLERVRRPELASVEDRRREIEGIIERMAPLLGNLPADPTAFLYDEETGLPK